MNFGTISPREIDSYLFKPDYILIDIRSPRDFRRRHIKGAVCIPYENLYCERGSTSMKAARELAEAGYRVLTLVGGIQSYKGRNLEQY